MQISLRASLLLALLALCGLVSGCVSVVSTGDSAAGVSAALVDPNVSPTPPLHEVDISGVDLDPPASSGALARGQPVRLLVVLENRGSEIETNVKAEAHVYSSASGALVADASSTLDQLAPGETSVVSIGPVLAPSVETAWDLRIDVSPGDPSSESWKSWKTYHIELAPGS